MANPALAVILARPSVNTVLSLLNVDGEHARIVGGAVRNALLDVPVSDIDIATTALPDVVLARAKSAGIHAVPTGYEHGTITLIIGGHPFEVTTLREDVETNGRHAIVRFGRSFEADALRRDFTINALSLDQAGHVHDYTGGLADIASRRVRFIGDAASRIREDYLRILRFFRFSASYSAGHLDEAGLEAVSANLDGLAFLSRERIRQEFMKLLAADHAAPVVEVMHRLNILHSVCGTETYPQRLSHCIALEAARQWPADRIRRLLVLACEHARDVDVLREALRLTNREEARLSSAIAGAEAWPPGAGDHTALDRQMLYRLGEQAYRDALVLHACRLQHDVSAALDLPDHWTPPVFMLSGKDVLAAGVAKGPAVGHLLAEAEHAWLQAGMPSSEDDQRQLLDRILARHKL